MSQGLKRIRLPAMALAAAVLGAAPAGGQTTTPAPPVTPSVIEQQLRPELPPPSVTLPPEEAILTGREDLVLLQRREIFYLNARGGFEYTTNAFFSNDFKSDDIRLDLRVAGGVQTKVAQTVDVFADFSAATSRYDENGSLNYDVFGANVGLQVPFPGFSASLAYNPTFAFAPGFDQRLVTQHNIVVSLFELFTVAEDVAVVPRLTGVYSIADPQEFTNLSLAFGVTGVYRILPELDAVVGPRVYVRDYPDFFESLTGTERRDVGGSVSGGLQWTPYQGVQVSATLGAAATRSTRQANDYDALTVGPQLQGTVRF